MKQPNQKKAAGFQKPRTKRNKPPRPKRLVKRATVERRAAIMRAALAKAGVNGRIELLAEVFATRPTRNLKRSVYRAAMRLRAVAEGAGGVA